MPKLQETERPEEFPAPRICHSEWALLSAGYGTGAAATGVAAAPAPKPGARPAIPLGDGRYGGLSDPAWSPIRRPRGPAWSQRRRPRRPEWGPQQQRMPDDC